MELYFLLSGMMFFEFLIWGLESGATSRLLGTLKMSGKQLMITA